MRKSLITLVTALAVLIGGLAVATPAQATYGDSRACVTAKEYRAIKKGQNKAQVKRILDGRGKKINATTRQYSKCGSKDKVRVTYDKRYTARTAKVANKRVIVNATTTTPTNPPSMSLAEFHEIQPGMTLQQVADIVGGSGTIFWKSVDWYGNVEIEREWDVTGCEYGVATIYFLNGTVEDEYYKYWSGC